VRGSFSATVFEFLQEFLASCEAESAGRTRARARSQCQGPSKPMMEAMPYPLTAGERQTVEATVSKISLKNGFAENLKLPANKFFHN